MKRPAALYIHIPFCSRVCPYCAFTVTSRYDDSVTRRFIDTVDLELQALNTGSPIAVETIYVGGGTPTALSPADLERLLGIIRLRCDTSAVREWTVEANPESVDPDKAQIMRTAGVTRASIGAQSMDDRFLRRLGRTHEAADVGKAIAILREAGIPDLNVDLIYGQPEQTLEDWKRDVEAVLDLGIGHASLYELTFEPGTPFGRGRQKGAIPQIADSLAVSMFFAAKDILSARGIEWYEVSNFAIPGRESLHNQVYWRNDPYFGVGPGAFACIDSTRTMNATDLAEWTRLVESTGSGVGERTPLSRKDVFVETLSSGLRTRAGVDLKDLLERTGIDVHQTHGAYLEDLRARGLADPARDRLRLTLDGVLVLDSILLGFLTDALQGAAAR